MFYRNIQIIFFITILLGFLNKRAHSDIRNNYTIISEMQSNNGDLFEANGDVKIVGDNNFSASSDKLVYEKEESKLNLIGNVKVSNYKTDNLFIEKISGDDLVFFFENGELKVTSKKGNKVKTYLKFLENQ